MAECSECNAKTQTYLCPHCISTLRRQLLGLPTIIDHLTDTALGQTRLTNDHSRNLAFESRTPTTNERANQLLDEIRCTLGQWATETARTHQLIISAPLNWTRPITEYKLTSRDHATFLAAHAQHLANDPDINELCASLRRYIRRGINLINRRIPEQFCGPCPTLITEHHHCTDCGHHEHLCATRLMARHGTTTVTCPACNAQHDVAKLVNHLLARADHFRATIPEINRVLRMLGEPVPMRTLYSWAAAGRLKPSGYLRANRKTIGISRHHPDDKPVYRVSDARKQRTEKPRETTRKK